MYSYLGCKMPFKDRAKFWNFILVTTLKLNYYLILFIHNKVNSFRIANGMSRMMRPNT